MKLTEECVMYTEKYVLVKIMFTKGLNMSLPLRAQLKTVVHEVETRVLSGKEKVF